jgi:hypothetical protein
MAKAAKQKVKRSKAEVERARLAARKRIQKHRAKLRAKGLRPIQMWVLDTNNPKVVAEIKRQCLLVRDDPQEKQILDEIEAMTDFDSWK